MLSLFSLCLSLPLLPIFFFSHIVMKRPELVVELVPGSDDERPRPVVALVDDDDVARGDGPRAVDAEVPLLLAEGFFSVAAASARGQGGVVAVVGSCESASLCAQVDVEDHFFGSFVFFLDVEIVTARLGRPPSKIKKLQENLPSFFFPSLRSVPHALHRVQTHTSASSTIDVLRLFAAGASKKLLLCDEQEREKERKRQR